MGGGFLCPSDGKGLGASWCGSKIEKSCLGEVIYCSFLLLAQKKRTKRKRHPAAWPSASPALHVIRNPRNHLDDRENMFQPIPVVAVKDFIVPGGCSFSGVGW